MGRSLPLRCLAALLGGLAALVCSAADSHAAEPIVTDRPDVTESSEIVDRGLVQIETGYVFLSSDRNNEKLEVTAFPATLVRVGLDPKVELRFEWFGYISEQRKENRVDTDNSGAGNTALGVKIKFREEDGAAPQLALLVDAVLPTGEKSLRADRIDPQARLAGAHTLSDRIGLGWNVGITAFTVEDDNGDFDTLGVGRYSLAAGIGISERWGSFVELFGLIPVSGSAAPENLFDAGFTYLVRDTLQLDFSGGVGLSQQADDWFFATGLSIRLPH